MILGKLSNCGLGEKSEKKNYRISWKKEGGKL